MNTKFAAMGLLALTTGYGARTVQDRTWAQVPPQTRQVVLIYDHRGLVDKTELDIVTVNPKSIVAFGLVPLDHQAALEPRSYMICEPYTEHMGTVVGPNNEVYAPYEEIAFKCGGKRYLFQKLDIQ